MEDSTASNNSKNASAPTFRVTSPDGLEEEKAFINNDGGNIDPNKV